MINSKCSSMPHGGGHKLCIWIHRYSTLTDPLRKWCKGLVKASNVWTQWLLEVRSHFEVFSIRPNLPCRAVWNQIKVNLPYDMIQAWHALRLRLYSRCFGPKNKFQRDRAVPCMDRYGKKLSFEIYMDKMNPTSSWLVVLVLFWYWARASIVFG